MKRNTKLLLATAALGGLMAGQNVHAVTPGQAADGSGVALYGDSHGCGGKSACPGKKDDDKKACCDEGAKKQGDCGKDGEKSSCGAKSDGEEKSSCASSNDVPSTVEGDKSGCAGKSACGAKTE